MEPLSLFVILRQQEQLQLISQNTLEVADLQTQLGCLICYYIFKPKDIFFPTSIEMLK